MAKSQNKKTATSTAATNGQLTTGATKSAKSKTSGSQKSLKDLFHDGLKDIYSAETQLIEALPKMEEAAQSEELKNAFADHLEQTKKQAKRLEKIMQHLGVDPGGETCEAMEGLIKEGEEIIQNYPESLVRDSALIIASQKVEHYEIASYGSLCELAEVLGMDKIHDTLGKSLDEEEDTDSLLSDIAKDVNDEAYAEVSFDDDEEEEKTPLSSKLSNKKK